MSIPEYTQPTVYCAGTMKAQAVYNETPFFAPGTFYPKGFQGQGTSLILRTAARSTIKEALSLHLVPGRGSCDGRPGKGEPKLHQDARVTLNLDIQDLNDLAGLLGYKLVPTV